jgi:hypothetical protein
MELPRFPAPFSRWLSLMFHKIRTTEAEGRGDRHIIPFCPAWLEESGPAGVICNVMDSQYWLPALTDPTACLGGSGHCSSRPIPSPWSELLFDIPFFISPWLEMRADLSPYWRGRECWGACRGWQLQRTAAAGRGSQLPQLTASSACNQSATTLIGCLGKRAFIKMRC